MRDVFAQIAIAALVLFCMLALYGNVRAQQVAPPIDIPCPTDESCRILVITKSEENVLAGENGILATAAQARSLDLGQFVAYFRQKIALAPAGKNVPPVISNEPPKK